MTQITLPVHLRNKIQAALRKGGTREIGGVLMGEQIRPGVFRIVDLTIQMSGGTIASFIRSLVEALRALAQFFSQTDHSYTRFNYLGEWHSHPSFEPVPSGTDHETMLQIVSDPTVGASFAVLLIVKLNGSDSLSGSVTVYRDEGLVEAGHLFLEDPQ